jgi:exonuclease VII small subunit
MKLNYLDWYMVELRQNLHGRVSLEQEESLLSQSRMHLEALVEELESEGLSLEEAEKVAITRFGQPNAIARGYVEAVAPKRSGLSPFITGFLLVAISISVLIPMAMLPLDPKGVGVGFVAAFGFIFGLIGLITKNVPSRMAFLTIAAIPLVCGLIAGTFLDFYQSEGKLATFLPRHSLEEMRQRAVKTRSEKTAFEDTMTKRWEQVLSDPKLVSGLKQGETYALPAFRVWGSKGMFITASFRNGETKYLFTADDKVLLQGNDIDLGKFGERKPEMLAGPMTLAAIKTKINESLKSFERGRSWDQQTITQLTTAANQGIFEKLLYFAGPTELLLLCFAMPFGLLTSFLGSKFARHNWRRGRKLRLA